ncbi:methionine gamma-lyase [Fictibacillus aquaticus]|uniref:L-methionine gamma-lyase n=2 Tax=Fictibacillus aquaticus TaxID=2021314 RepID=A0A235FAJ4_9BACL|nr:methionine gamma-lyase [Fictibacillus aquaticus]
MEDIQSRQERSRRFETEVIHTGYNAQQHCGSLAPPIFQTSTFVFPDAESGERRFAGEEEGFIYTRLNNPTVAMLEERIAALEKAEKGLAFGSGMAAVSAVLMGMVRTRDHILCSEGVYGCTFGLLNLMNERFGVSHSFQAMDEEERIRAAIRPETALIYVESPINPTMKLVDLKLVADIAKEYHIPVVVDNTFSSPYLQRPLELGCDVVVHSATKYLCGHGDVIGGLAAGSKELMSRLAMTTQKDIGGVMSPFDAWLVLRGMKTLPVRMDRHCSNASELAIKLKNHHRVSRVLFPGDPEFAQYGIAALQMDGPGGLISFELTGAKEDAQRFMNSLELIKIAVSLGDAETLIQHPATMTHAVVPEADRQNMGISDTLLRLSVGLEAWQDIWADIEQSLNSL